jgi:hypothetical protein
MITPMTLCGCVCASQGCNTEAVRMLLGGEDLSDANMLSHLGIIEQRSNELLQVCVGRMQQPHQYWGQQPYLATCLHISVHV